MVDDEVAGGNAPTGVEYVPCLAAMSSYEAENGDAVRYMSDFVFRDGSPMSSFFDDEAFRESLDTVVMVGYEWQENDKQLVEKYFESNLLSVTIVCVSPNPGFSSLGEEMSHFKNLSDDEKERHTTNHTMGPKKMKRFILDTTTPLQTTTEKKDSAEKDNAVESLDGEENEIEIDSPPDKPKEEEEVPPKKKIPVAIDHNATSFACRMCRTVLFGESHLADDHKKALHSLKRTPNRASGTVASCQSFFCDESVLEWLAPDGADVEGKLACPHCNFKLGHWNWSGAQCSCGTWVVPAIQIPMGKVDVILPPSERAKVSPIMIVAPKASYA